MTWLNAIIKSLKGSDGKNANEIWRFIKDNNLVSTKAKDPLNNVIYPLLQRHTDNISDERSGKAHFTSFGTPRKFKLIETEPRIKKFGEIDTNEEDFDDKDINLESDTNKKYTFAEAAQIILKQNDNKPMSAKEIWNEIESQNLVETKGFTPWASINTIMIRLSVNSKAKSKKDLEIFKIVEDNPYKFILLNPSGEVQNVTDDEVDDVVEKIKVYQQNPFKQAICVLGESGAGKSVTVETILENEEHEFEFIIPTAATTGLLAQFSPSKSTYVPSRLGRMLMSASKNPDKLYTAVFDEMHKSNVIEMINDELLQAVSTKRNRGRRFISLDEDTAEIYQDSELDTERGNLLIPDNFGFIFISSKPRVISNNTDFFNRVDIVLLKSYEEETIETSEELLSKKLDSEEKMRLSSTRND